MKALCYATLFFILSVPTPLFANTASDVFDKASKSTVVILAYDQNNEMDGLGSGVVLPDGSIATNCHVIEDASKISVRYRQKEYPAETKYTDWDRDTCSVTAKGLKATPVNIGSTQGLRVGSRVYAIGAPSGLELTISDGIISSLRPIEGGQYLQITASISPGSSGGGLYNSEGYLIGLTSFYIGEGQNLNFALPVEWVGELPDRSEKTIRTSKTLLDWVEEGLALHNGRQWPQLIDHLKKWTEVMPEQMFAWKMLGNTYNHAGNYQKAIEIFTKILAKDSELAWAWSGLGNSYNSLWQHKKAIDAFKKSLLVDPEDYVAWFGIANSYISLREYEEAISSAKKGMKLSPKNDMDLHFAWTILGRSYSSIGRTDQAVKAWQNVLKINPNDAYAWSGLGDAYLNVDIDRSIEAYQKSLRIEPNVIHRWIGLGDIYKKNNQPNKALEAYNIVFDIEPQNNLEKILHESTWFRIGTLYKEYGNKSKVMEIYNYLRKNEPTIADSYFEEFILP